MRCKRGGDLREQLIKGEKINNSFYRVPIKPNFSSLFIYASLPFATEYCNIGIIDFIEFRKWLHKGSVLQHENPKEDEYYFPPSKAVPYDPTNFCLFEN